MAAATAASDLRALSRHRSLVGVRPMLQDLAEDDWILRPELLPALDAVVASGLVFDALVRPRHLPHLIRLVDAHPQLRVVIDHAAKLPILPRPQNADERAAWRRDLAALARSPQVHCKLSGLVTEAHAAWTPADLSAVADTVLELFGPDRVLWGSDWPVVLMNGSYERWWDATQELLHGLPPADRDAILGVNAARLYLRKG
jgi:L-fuconolactonase